MCEREREREREIERERERERGREKKERKAACVIEEKRVRATVCLRVQYLFFRKKTRLRVSFRVSFLSFFLESFSEHGVRFRVHFISPSLSFRISDICFLSSLSLTRLFFFLFTSRFHLCV